MKTLIYLVALLGLMNSARAAIHVPTSVKMKVYGVWVAADNCSNPVKVFENTSASVQDLMQSPTLGGGDIPDNLSGYGCVILKVADIFDISYAGGSCQQDIFTHENYYGNAAPATNGQKGDDINDALNTPSITPSASAAINEQVVYLYLSVNSAPDSAIFNKPTTTFVAANGANGGAPITGGEYLAHRFVVNGSSAGVFKVRNLTGVDDSGCVLQASGPIWDFVNE